MKKLYLLILLVAFGLTRCSSIPDKPVFEKLSTDELANAIKDDTAFSSFYENAGKFTEKMSDIKRAKYNEVTYRRLFTYIKFVADTTYWNPLFENWEKEWTNKFAVYLSKADSSLNYWRSYLDEHSLNRYVNIELAQINKEYYEYIGGIKDVQLGFRLTPLQGTIEQIEFTYGYKAKINGDNKYYSKHSCISTSPFISSSIRFWEVGYADKEIFTGKNVESFLRDYNLYIEITSIRKDGTNMSTDDVSVPKEILECFENEKDYPALYEYSKEKLIKNLINKNFLTKWEYRNKKADEIIENKDKLCFDFFNDL